MNENKKFTLIGMIIGGFIAITSAIFAGWYVKKHTIDFEAIDIGLPKEIDPEFTVEDDEE